MHDSFRPKFPLDPFAGHADPQPWLVSLPEPSPSCNVFLILGEPSQHDLEPLIHSQHLVNSLLLVVTHLPPQIPPSVVPSVRVLRTLQPLLSNESGAVGLASVLERAERLARQWRTHPGSQTCLQFCERVPGGEFTVAESIGCLPSTAAASLPRSARPVSTISSKKSISSLRLERFHETAPARSFDAILNFLPPSLPDKSMFKQSVLVTTLSQTFLNTTNHQPTIRSGPPSPSMKRSSVLSWFQSNDEIVGQLSSSSPMSTIRSHSSSTVKINSLHLPPPSRAHLIHILPISHSTKTKPALVQSLEQFLLTFHYRAPLNSKLDFTKTPFGSVKQPSSVSLPKSMAAINEGPVPYILPANLLGHGLGSGEFNLLELILLGALDTPRSDDHTLFSKLSYPTRVWIGDPHDVRIRGTETYDEDNPPRRPPRALASEGRHSTTSMPTLDRLTTSKTANSASSSSESSTEISSAPIDIIALDANSTMFQAPTPPQNYHYRRHSKLHKETPMTMAKIAPDKPLTSSGKWKFWKKVK